MTVSLKQDITISVDVPQKNGETRKVFLTELDNVQYIHELAEISKHVAISDTADLLFRLFAKSHQGDVDLEKVSKRIPCLGKQYLPKLQEFFAQPEINSVIQEYNLTTDKMQKREIRKQVIDKINNFISQNIQTKDLQYNFSKFKYKFDTDRKQSSFKEKMSQAIDKISAGMLGLNTRDPFTLAAYEIWKDNIKKRDEKNRQAYWLLIRDEHNKMIGMICISSKQLKDKRINKNIIGHSGYILDPSVQGRGYVSALNPVMIDFMYDNMNNDDAENSLFATTCDEFNENSQGMQIKSGAHVLKDEYGRVIIDNGKMHWYATKQDIMNSELMTQAAEHGVKYNVSFADGRPGYMKILGKHEHFLTSPQNLKGINYDR